MNQHVKYFFMAKGCSGREADVAECVSRGLYNKEAASELFVCEKTIKFHLTNIYKKIGVKSRAQLIVMSTAAAPPPPTAAPDESAAAVTAALGDTVPSVELPTGAGTAENAG